MKKWIHFALLFLVSIGSTSGLAAATDRIVFIVNAGNPAASLSASEVRDYFFKRRRQWPDGTSVRFIDKTSESPARKVFLDTVLHKTASEVELFWIGEKLYTGNTAPLQEASEAVAIKYVSTFKGAIGYLPASAVPTDKGVKVIRME